MFELKITKCLSSNDDKQSQVLMMIKLCYYVYKRGIVMVSQL